MSNEVADKKLSLNLSGESDTIVPVLAAHHTKALVRHAELRIFQPLGHLSIGAETLRAAADLAKAHA